MPNISQLEQWMEEQLQDAKDFHSRVHASILSYTAQLYEQIHDYTPTLDQIESSIPVIGPAVAHVATSSRHIVAPKPPPPPKMPLYKSIVYNVMARADAVTGSRRRTSIMASVALVGITSAVLTRDMWLPAKYVQRPRRTPRSRGGLRCDAIVVLGADTPVGQALCHHLAAQGFIVLASVMDDESKQTFDSLIPPSSRGYIKSIVLQTSASARAEDVTFFVRAVTASKELRWPLTAAGDPYARPGSEVEIVGVINALSYRSVNEGRASVSSSLSSSSGSMSAHSALDLEAMSNDMSQRAIVPLATIKGLIPILSTNARPRQADTSGIAEVHRPLILSIVNADDELDGASQALVAGMARIKNDLTSARTASHRIIAGTTLKVEGSSLSTLFRSVFPSFVGGIAPQPSRPVLNRNGSSIGADATSSGRRALDASGRIGDRSLRPSTRRSSLSMSGSTSESRMQRSAEVRTILQAASTILLETSVESRPLRSMYIARLPSHALIKEPRASSVDGYETTILSRALHLFTLPFSFASRALSSTGLDVSALWNRGPGAQYRGTRNTANSRPAYGPGPGPASNTHSRSCIRKQTSSQESSTKIPEEAGSQSRTDLGSSGAKARRNRPASPASTSSEAARSSESEGSRSGGGHSGQISSAPPSNPDMSSSGLLSSVPSSAFGDGSEEERLVDSDFPGSTDSPAMGSVDDEHYTRAGGRRSARHASVSSDGDDTALGARNYDANDAHPGQESVSESASSRTEETPSASRYQQTPEEAYGFPSAASMQSRGDEAPWMGPPSRGGTDSPSAAGRSSADAAAGNDTPLGHSWVALGQSSLDNQSEQNRRR